MSEKKLEKEFILTANFHGLSHADKLQKEETMANAQDSTGYVPDLDPTAQAVLQEVTATKLLISQREAVILQATTLTKQINDKIDHIEDEIVRDWMPQTEQVIKPDQEKAKALGFGVKGIFDGHAPESVSIKNSSPLIDKVVNSHSYEITIHVINSESKSIALPFDVDRTELYEIMAQEMPKIINLKEWSYLGVVKKGKFITHFAPEDLNKVVWFIARYIPKAEDGSPELSGVIRGNVL